MPTPEDRARCYELAKADLSDKVTDLDRLISKAVHETQGGRLGPRAMIQAALVIFREMERR